MVPGFRWRIANQSQPPHFTRLLAELAAELGPARLLTGAGDLSTDPALVIERGPAYHRGSVAQRVRSWLAFTIVAAWKMLVRDPRQLNFVVTNPPFLPQVAWLARRLRGSPYVLLIWDVYPDHLATAGLITPRNPLYRLWHACNRVTYRDASLVIAIGERMAEGLRESMGDDGASLHVAVIHNWADIGLLRPLPKADNAFAREHGQADKITVMYSGNLGHTHGTDIFPAVAALLRDEPAIHLVVIGDGLGSGLAGEVRERGLTNITLLPYQPWEVLPLSLATADIGLVSQSSGSSHLSVPSKTYSMLAVGTAIVAITDHDSDLALLIEREECGIVCPPGDAAAVADAIRALAANPERLQRMRERSRAAALAHYSHEAIRERYLSVLRELAESARTPA